MRNIFRNLVAAAGLALSILSVASLSVPVAFAQPVPQGQRGFVPRYFQTQQLHYTRFTVNFNSCTPPGNCSVRVGTVPYNAYLLRVTYQGTVAFNSTTNSIQLGRTSGAADIMAAVAGFQATINSTQGTIVAANAGVGFGSGVGNTAVQTGLNGGFDVFATMSFTGTAPTAGQAVFVLEWAAPNDGLCAPVPLGATAGAC
jgi:hypothetical protein